MGLVSGVGMACGVALDVIAVVARGVQMPQGALETVRVCGGVG